MKNEQECWDEFMRLIDLQKKYNDGKCFLPTDSIQDRVMAFMDEMREAGLEENKQSGSYFRNWFFRCQGRLFSICKYSNGKMELRWG